MLRLLKPIREVPERVWDFLAVLGIAVLIYVSYLALFILHMHSTYDRLAFAVLGIVVLGCLPRSPGWRKLWQKQGWGIAWGQLAINLGIPLVTVATLFAIFICTASGEKQSIPDEWMARHRLGIIDAQLRQYASANQDLLPPNGPQGAIRATLARFGNDKAAWMYGDEETFRINDAVLGKPRWTFANRESRTILAYAPKVTTVDSVPCRWTLFMNDDVSCCPETRFQRFHWASVKRAAAIDKATERAKRAMEPAIPSPGG